MRRHSAPPTVVQIPVYGHTCGAKGGQVGAGGGVTMGSGAFLWGGLHAERDVTHTCMGGQYSGADRLHG